MKHLLGLLAIPAILLGQVFAFSTLSEIQQEIKDLDAHQTYAAQQQRYHQNRADFYSMKVKEIAAAKEERRNFLTFRQLEQVKESSAGEVEAHEAPNVQVGQKPFNLDHLAWSVAGAETNHCTKGYGKNYNNCFGIRSGNTAPCPKIGINRMCIYETPEESYEAFKKIRSTRYKGRPDINKARKWTGNDHAATWLANVNHLYYNN